jgi:hypothetical protein
MRNVQWLRNCILFCRWNWKCRCFCGLAAVPAYWSAYQLRRISICPVVRRHTYGPNSMPAPLSHIPPRPLLSLTNCTQPDFVPFLISCHIMFIEKRAPGGSVLTQYVAGDWDSIPGKGRDLSFSAASRSVLSVTKPVFWWVPALECLFRFYGVLLDESLDNCTDVEMQWQEGKEFVLLDKINITVISLSALSGCCISSTCNGVNVCRMWSLSVHVWYKKRMFWTVIPLPSITVDQVQSLLKLTLLQSKALLLWWRKICH